VLYVLLSLLVLVIIDINLYFRVRVSVCVCICVYFFKVLDKDHPEVKSFIKRSFEDARRLYNEGKEHFKAGNSKEAIACCENALIINGEDVKLYVMLSKMHRQKGDLNEAFRYLKDAEKLFHKGDPYNAFPNIKLPFEISRQKNLVINEMAMKEAIAGDCEKAIVLLNKAIASERQMNEEDMQIPFIYFMNRGDCYRSLNEPLFAIADYKLALDRSPGEE
jgi:tetratricopeptide (TPR) repeat protein